MKKTNIETKRWAAIDAERKRLNELGLSRFPGMTEAERAAVDFMAATGAMQASCHQHLKTPHRSHESLVLTEGELFRWQPRPKDVTKMADKQCYFNALHLAMDRDWRYVEGFASKMMVTMHAWCVDDAGRVIDPTWSEDDEYKPNFYVGVSMDPLKVWGHVVNQEYYGVLPNSAQFLNGDFSQLT